MKELDDRVHDIHVHDSICDESSHQCVAATRSANERLTRSHNEGKDATSDDAQSVDCTDSDGTVNKLEDNSKSAEDDAISKKFFRIESTTILTLAGRVTNFLSTLISI